LSLLIIICRLLYKHLFDIIDQLYGQNLGCEPPLPVAECISRILNIGQDLAAWEESLPIPLQIITLNEIRMAKQPTADAPQSHLKFRVILTLRYYHLQTLLHRPILSKYLKACANPTMQDLAEKRLLQQIGFNSLQVCSEAAITIIDIIHEVLNSTPWHKCLLGAWWFSLYYSKMTTPFTS
jgi:hypothetical protein